jgi:1,4-alpha-glucan branching enzyme
MLPLSSPVIADVVEGRCATPFDVLGAHRRDAGAGWEIRLFLPWAADVAVRVDGERLPATRVHDEGFFTVEVAGERPFPRYQVEARTTRGEVVVFDDPYGLPPVLDEDHLQRFARGELMRVDRLLGSHTTVHEGLQGTRFGVWAPNARNVNLMGSFNGWQARCHPMRPRGSTGVWELFVPGVAVGALYKYEVCTRQGRRAEKADPCGFAMELRPQTASVVWDLDSYRWNDDSWMAERARRQASDAPLAIYEVHLGSWRRHPRVPEAGEASREREGWLSYRELAEQLVPYAAEMGFTHLELLPVTEHPLDASWGYQTVGYFAPTSRFGSPDDFRHLVDAAHRAGLGVILDWVPGHFPQDGHGLVYFDGTHLYEHADPRQGVHPDWGTRIYNYGRPEVSAFLLSSALFWLEQYHVDGLRVDAVASMLHLDFSRKDGQWVPNRYGGRENLDAVAFLERLNVEVHRHHPDARTFAEESSAWPRVSHPVEEGGLGFDLKWNMGWMNDMLRYCQADPLYRKGMHGTLTFSIHYAFSERFLLPLSHDEVVHGKASLLSKMPGEREAKLANLRLLLGYMYAHPGKKLLFMGGELGQWREWDFAGELDWSLLEHEPHRALWDYVRQLNRLHREMPALHEKDFDWTGFQWIDFKDADQSVVSFLRWDAAGRDFVLAIANFTPVPRVGYQLGVPKPGTYEILLSSDWNQFGGTGSPRAEAVEAHEGRWQDFAYALTLDLPPLALLLLARRR